MRILPLNTPFVVLSLLLLCCQAAAQHMNAPDAPCRTPASNAEETSCFIAASKAADTKLNEVYSHLRVGLSPEEQKDLQQAQRLWLRFRDADCSAERNLYGSGTAAPMVYAACMEADTRQRAAELKTMYGWRLEKLDKPLD